MELGGESLVRIVTEMNKKRTKLKKDAAMQRKKKMFVYYSLLIFPALLHSFYMN
jgi:hypothetical protein